MPSQIENSTSRYLKEKELDDCNDRRKTYSTREREREREREATDSGQEHPQRSPQPILMVGSVWVRGAVGAVLLAAMAAVWRAPGAEAHGRLLQPASRSSVWRVPGYGHIAPHNYNDNELNCGGLGVSTEASCWTAAFSELRR